MQWEEFTECFDSSNGGALFCADGDDGEYKVTGVLWLDGGQDDKHYLACTASFPRGTDSDYGVVTDRYIACDAFNGLTDPFVEEEIGWFTTIESAVNAVKAFVSSAESGISHVAALVNMELERGEWDEELCARLFDEFGEMYSLEVVEGLGYGASILSCLATSNFSDAESTAQTLEYCLREDLLDSHYPIADVEIIEGWPLLD